MSLPLPLVNYAQLHAAFGDSLDAFKSGRPEAALLASNGSNLSQVQLIGFISSAMQQLDKAKRTDGTMETVDDRNASLLQTFLARQAGIHEKTTQIAETGLEAKFDSHDILGWAGSLFDWLKGLDKHPFISNPQPLPEPMKNSWRVAVLSDWGTGLYGAPVCAASIKNSAPFDMLLHLGDVYYSGDIDEVEARFLNVWPTDAGAISRSLNSNHEMYSGGHGYFEKILPAFGQTCSYFALQNDHWLIAALDTGYAEHDLYGDQAEWLIELVKKADQRKVVLFSHHQPYSLFEAQGDLLIQKLGPLLQAQKIFAWYWGHEHRCAIYKKHPIWNLLGRCVGHSGFPYFRDDFRNDALDHSDWIARDGKNLIPGCDVLDGPNPYVKDDPRKYGPNGYVTLDFNDAMLTETFHDPDGTVLRKNTLT